MACFVLDSGAPSPFSAVIASAPAFLPRISQVDRYGIRFSMRRDQRTAGFERCKTRAAIETAAIGIARHRQRRRAACGGRMHLGAGSAAEAGGARQAVRNHQRPRGVVRALPSVEVGDTEEDRDWNAPCRRGGDLEDEPTCCADDLVVQDGHCP